jgi:hypothetical protein
VVIAVTTMIVFTLAQLDSDVGADEARSAAVLVAGSVALINLALVAQPLNLLRRALVATMAVLFAAAFVMPWSRDLFELPVTPIWVYAMAAAFVAAAFPLLVRGRHLAERLWLRRQEARSQPYDGGS